MLSRSGVSSRPSALSMNGDADSSSGRKSSAAERLKLKRKLSKSLMLSGAASRAEPQHLSPSDEINLALLQKLREWFEGADASQSKSLELEQFTEAFQTVMGHDFSKKHLKELFMKIDPNGGGSINWDDFTNYMLLENQSLSTMRDDHAEFEKAEVGDPPSNSGNVHADMVTKILCLEADNGERKYPRYITSSRDATVRVWNATNLQLTRTMRSAAWVSDIAYMVGSSRVVAASTDRSLTFYDMGHGGDGIVGRISNLDGTPLCLNYYQPSHDREVIICGNDHGDVNVYSLSNGWHACDGKLPCHADSIKMAQGKEIENRETPSQYKAGKLKNFEPMTQQYFENIKAAKHMRIHDDWVMKVQYIPDLTSMITCSLDSKIKFSDLERGSFKREFALHKKAVNSFAWCKSYKFIASGGQERHVILWNPYTCKSMTYLSHNASIQEIVMNEQHNQLITLSVDKVVKVWDVRNYKCIQTIVDKNQYRPENRITAMSYDNEHNCLALGSKKINIWPLKLKKKTKSSHEFPLCSALYNPSFGQVVSGDDGSNICVWNIENGELVFKFAEAHENSKISAMCFDEVKRRLITGSHSGTIKMWNFSNGQCLKEFIKSDKQKGEITAISYITEGPASNQNHFVVCVGWDRKISLWPDANDPRIDRLRVIPDTNCPEGHQHDILTVAHCPGNLLATGGYDGSIIVWNLDTGHVKYVFKHPSPDPRDPTDEKAVEKLCYLVQSAALVSFGAEGIIAFWDLREGIKIIDFDTAHKKSETLTAAFVDSSEKYLFTADTGGYIKVFSMQDFEKANPNSDQFAPLYYWKAHEKTVVSLEFVPEHQIIISASADANIHCWTLEGMFIGTFGQSKRWTLGDVSTYVRAFPEYEIDSEDEDEPASPELSPSKIAHPKNNELASDAEEDPISDPEWDLDSPENRDHPVSLFGSINLNELLRKNRPANSSRALNAMNNGNKTKNNGAAKRKEQSIYHRLKVDMLIPSPDDIKIVSNYRRERDNPRIGAATTAVRDRRHRTPATTHL
eukprot:GILJ01009216.1.p1 GENE.GILJ01009216.1~~GILJ01009216.1.p1  ORF type:complete len:1025 (-),score=150.44 GILJ01009216.1:215-3289(-)